MDTARETPTGLEGRLNFGPRARAAETAAAGPARAIAVTGEQRAATFMAASLLLDYPRDDFAERCAAVREILGELPAQLAQDFASFLAYADGLDKLDLEAEYVRTFDERRRCALELSYYATGDTRQRGQALLAFRELYKAAGFEQLSDELPDYLPAILELAARSADDVAQCVLPAHREGLEVLRAALLSLHSPWASLIDAVCAVLPEISEEATERYQKLIRTGPPTELVGIRDLPFPILQEA